MLYNVVVWSLLTIACFGLGSLLLNCCQVNHFARNSDQFLLAIWLGIIGYCILFLALSFVVPLSTGTGLIVYLTVIIIATLKSLKTELQQLQKLFSGKYLGFYYLIAFLVSSLITKPITWFDTGLYHWHSIKWLANFGTVSGIALINAKHGFNASWFAFSAPLNLPILGSHVGAVSNGFVFFIALLHFFVAIQHLQTKRTFVVDWFISIFFSLLLLTYITTIFLDSPILISYSPDVPVNLMIGITTWTILLIFNDRLYHQPKKHFNQLFIPLFLALGTVTIKLTALPLLLPTFFLILFHAPQKIKALIISSILSIVLLLPMFAYSMKTTGCLLYPSSSICFNFPWAINQQSIKIEVGAITGVRKSKQPFYLRILNNRWTDISNSPKLQITLLLFILSTVFSILIIKNQKKRQQAEFIWTIILALGGMIFLIIKSPLLRFGVGYFITISCLFISIKLSQTNIYTSPNKAIKIISRQRYFTLAIIILISILISHNMSFKNILIAPSLPNVQLKEAQMNDIEYRYPDNWTIKCWDAPLPCSHIPIQGNVKLKNPRLGISEGFIRQSPSN